MLEKDRSLWLDKKANEDCQRKFWTILLKLRELTKMICFPFALKPLNIAGKQQNWLELFLSITQNLEQ